MNIVIAPEKILKILLIFIIILLTGNIVTIYLLPIVDYNYSNSAIRLFNFDTEQNIPTLFSFLILAFSSFLLLHIGKSHKKTNNDYKVWLLLGYVFMFLALDESLSLHEILSSVMRKIFDLKGIFYYAWVIPYALILIVFSIPLVKFLLNLPKEISKLFVFSGIIFVIGAMGFEMFESVIHSNIGKKNMSYIISYTVEESLEMIGISLFVFALLKYILLEKLQPIHIGFKN